jgi:transposase
VLEARIRAPTREQREVFRARIMLLAAEGGSTRSIARTLNTMPRTVSAWRGRFAREGLAGLNNKPHRGPVPKYGVETGRRILALLDEPPPKGYARWTGPLLAAALGDVHEQHVWRFLRTQKIDLTGRKSWCESSDPAFAVKVNDVVRLDMAPPENAIVICVDEKSSIQALERAQGYLKLPNGRTLTGHSHDYKRNGTSALFAAFEGRHRQGHCRPQETPAARRIPRLHERHRRRLYGYRHPRCARQPQHPVPGTIAGSSVIPMCGFTSRRRERPGSIKSRSGSRSWKENPCTLRPSHPSGSSGSPSMPSSKATTTTRPFVWTKAKFSSLVSRADVSANCDPG